MTFVNEYISEKDLEKYSISDEDRKKMSHAVSPQWTIDRERDMFIRRIHQEREEFSAFSHWIFYWKGEPLWFVKESLGVRTKLDGKRHSHSRIRRFNIPERLMVYRDEIYRDLREAFNVYGGGGVFSTVTNYVHDLEFDKESRACFLSNAKRRYSLLMLFLIVISLLYIGYVFL